MDRLDEIKARLDAITAEKATLTLEAKSLANEQADIIIDRAMNAARDLIGKRAVWRGTGFRPHLCKGTIEVFDARVHRPCSGSFLTDDGELIVVSDSRKSLARYQPERGWRLDQ